MALGLSPVDELRKKVELLSSKLDSLSKLNSQEVLERIEDVEDLQLLEKLNSIEMREELQNIRTEIESLGFGSREESSSTETPVKIPSDIEGRLSNLEQKIQNIKVSSGSDVDLGSLKKEIIQEVRTSLPLGEHDGQSINTNDLEEKILSKLNDKIKNKSGGIKGIFSKSSKGDFTELKMSIKEELLPDIRSIVDNEVEVKLKDFPTRGVTKTELKSRLSEFKSELKEKVIEKSIDKNITSLSKSVEDLEDRFSKTDSQLGTLLASVPRDIKHVKNELGSRIDITESDIEKVKKDIKDIKFGGIEGYHQLVSKDDAKKIADEKINILRNEILTDKLSGTDEKYEEALSRITSLDDRFTVLRSEVIPFMEKIHNLDKLSDTVKEIESHVHNVVEEKLGSVDPNVITGLVDSVETVKQKIDKMEKEPNEYIKTSLESLKSSQERDRETYEDIAKFVHLETERFEEIVEDIKSSVNSKLNDFEKKIPHENVWIEVESLRSRLAALEKNYKEIAVNERKKITSSPAIIE